MHVVRYTEEKINYSRPMTGHTGLYLLSEILKTLVIQTEGWLISLSSSTAQKIRSLSFSSSWRRLAAILWSSSECLCLMSLGAWPSLMRCVTSDWIPTKYQISSPVSASFATERPRRSNKFTKSSPVLRRFCLGFAYGQTARSFCSHNKSSISMTLVGKNMEKRSCSLQLQAKAKGLAELQKTCKRFAGLTGVPQLASLGKTLVI